MSQADRDRASALPSAAGGWLATVSGTVVHGAGRGRSLGFPTANVAPDSPESVPGPAVYSGWMGRASTGSVHPVTISVGTNPTFTDATRTHVEVYCHDLNEQFYGEHVTVWFVSRIRDTVRFGTVEDLVDAATKDVEITAATLSEEHRARALDELRACPACKTQ